MSQGLADRRLLIRTLEKSGSKHIRRFVRKFDLMSDYMFKDAVCNVHGVMLHMNMRITVDVYTEDQSCQAVIEAGGHPLIFVGIDPNELQKLQ